MNCPKCGEGKALAEVELAGIEVDRCSICNGVWLDEYELDDLLDIDEAELKKIMEGQGSEQLDGVEGNCPRDGTPLGRVRLAQSRETTVDMCSECQGLWLDGGEFKRLREKS